MSERDHQDEDLERALRGLPDPEADEGFRLRMREAFVAGTIEPIAASSPRGRLLAFRLAAAAASVAAVLLVLVAANRGPGVRLLDATGTGVVVVDGREVDLTDRAALAESLRPGASVTVPATATLDLVVPGTALLEIAGGTRVSLPPTYGRWWPSNVELEILSGEIRFVSGPDFPGRALRITTPHGIVVLTGTLVSVQCDEGGTCVCVLEGTARVGRDEADLESIPAGRRKVIPRAGEPEISPVAAPHADGVRRMLERIGDRFSR